MLLVVLFDNLTFKVNGAIYEHSQDDST